MLKCFIILLFLLHMTSGSLARTDFYAFNKTNVRAKIDSLKQALPVLKNTKRTDCLNELGEAYLAFDTDTAKVYARQALQEAEANVYIQGKAKAYKTLGRIDCIVITDLPAAEKYFAKSLELYLTVGSDQQIAWGWEALGYSKWVLSKFSEAMEAFEKAEALFKKVKDTNNLAGTYEFMSHTEIERGHYSKALEYTIRYKEITGEEDNAMLSILYAALGDTETSAEYNRKIPVTSDGGIYKYLGMASNFKSNQQFDSSFHYYELFAKYAKKAGAGPLIKLYAGLGDLYCSLKNYDSALVYLNEALAMSKKASDQNQVMNVLFLISKTYGDSGHYERAIQTAKELLNMAETAGARQIIRNAHFHLYRFYDLLHDKDLAFLHLKKYIAVKDSIDADMSSEKLAFYKTKSEKESAMASIQLLNKEKEIQQQELQKEALIKKILIGSLIAFVVIGIIIFRNITLKRKNEKLEDEKIKAKLQQQTTELEMQALRAQMNPHFIFNCLNAINGFILINESEAAADYLTRFSRLIRMVLNNSQKKFISLEDELETLRLYLYMESLRFQNNFHHSINCDDTIDAMSIYIPPLLLQPFVENAIWHGLTHKEGKGELRIELYCENEILHCTISDNGVGREKATMLKSKSAEKNKSMGMQITKNRMALLNQDLGGQSFFEIYDREDASGNPTGTTVFLKIKVSAMAEENAS